MFLLIYQRFIFYVFNHHNMCRRPIRKVANTFELQIYKLLVQYIFETKLISFQAVCFTANDVKSDFDRTQEIEQNFDIIVKLSVFHWVVFLPSEVWKCPTRAGILTLRFSCTVCLSNKKQIIFCFLLFHLEILHLIYA